MVAGANDLVGFQSGDRDQLVVEEPVLGGAGRFFMAGGGELVELGAREAPLRGDQFGADALWHQAFGVAPGHVLAERVAARQYRAAHRNAAHRLHAAGDDEVVSAGEHALGGEADGLLAAATLAVDGDAGNRFWESGAQQCIARDVDRLVADLGDGTGDNVVDLYRVHACARYQFAQAMGQQVGGQHVVQRAASLAFADGGADSTHDDGVAALSHDSSLSPEARYL